MGPLLMHLCQQLVWLTKDLKRTGNDMMFFQSFSIVVSILVCWEKSSSKTNILIFLLSLFQPFYEFLYSDVWHTEQHIDLLLQEKESLIDIHGFTRSRLTRQFRLKAHEKRRNLVCS